tara:strand:+ start:315 stop:473 length:159 start_codon:yes stop_codon:yes gene_type:complete
MMANINTKRKRRAGVEGYGKKRGHALMTGFGQAHGSKKRKTYKIYKIEKPQS